MTARTALAAIGLAWFVVGLLALGQAVRHAHDDDSPRCLR